MMNHTINLAKKEILEFGNIDKTVSGFLMFAFVWISRELYQDD